MKQGLVALCVAVLMATLPGCSGIRTTVSRIETAAELSEYLIRGERRQNHVDLVSATHWVIYNGEEIVDTVKSAKAAVDTLQGLGIDSYRKISVRLSDPKNAALKRKLTEFAGALFFVLLKIWSSS